MNRRDFMLRVGGGAVCWPMVARAGRPAMPMVGFLGSTSSALFTDRISEFRKGLSETGYVEGRNVAIEYRWADGQYDRLGELVADLIRRQASVIVASATPAALAAKAATTTIPIAFQIAVDPVEFGLINTLNRPGGNLTGVTTFGVNLGPKQLELLHELVPAATMVALLVNPTVPRVAEVASRGIQVAARTLGLRLLIVNASTERDLDRAFATLVELRAGGLLIGTDHFFINRSQLLATLTVRHAMPTIAQFREFVDAGGLMSYGTSIADVYRQVGIYTGRILKGANPADLPVVQPTAFELSINLKTAVALGLVIAPSIMARADEVL